MQPKPPIKKRTSLSNNQNKFSGETKFPYKHQNRSRQQQLPHQPQPQPLPEIPEQQYVYQPPIPERVPDPEPFVYQQPNPEPQPVFTNPEPITQQPYIYQAPEPQPIPPQLKKPIMRKQQPIARQTPPPTILQPQQGGHRKEPGITEQLYPRTNVRMNPHTHQPTTLYPVIEQGDMELSPDEIEQHLVIRDQAEHQGRTSEEDEREFMGGKKLYDRQLMQQPMYDEPTMQILNDIAADESFPVLVQYITQLSHLGRQAQARLIARASAFQSKNQVFSNIQNLNDYMMAQDDFTYAQILSKADYSTYDMNADYFTAEAIMEAQFNIRLRRSKNALNLLQINTQRQESIMSQHPAQEEERKLRSKIPFLGQHLG
jgi:hypothetical protein